jgi:hypothetical protein
MILFLDFDGVLHDFPTPLGALWRHLPRLLAVLGDHPEVAVVVSSSWRCSEDWLDVVPVELRARVVGFTPVIPQPIRQQYPVGYVPEPVRYQEILSYLLRTQNNGEPWIALDDDRTLFPDNCQNLILCNGGFQDQEEEALRAVLERWRQRSSGIE